MKYAACILASAVWLAAGTAGADFTHRGGLWLQGVFMAAILATVFLTDLLKAFGARKLKNVLTNHTLFWVNRLAGAIMVGAGLVLMGSALGRLW